MPLRKSKRLPAINATRFVLAALSRTSVNRISAGLRKERKRNAEELRRAWEERRLVLFLGAGVSAPYGIPTWEDLVLDTWLSRPKRVLTSLDPRGLASWLRDRYQLPLEALARAARLEFGSDTARGHRLTTRHFRNRLRNLLYRRYNPKPDCYCSLPDIAQLIARSEGEGRRIPAVVTFNFDNLLEFELAKAGVRAKPVFRLESRLSSYLPVIHPHGFLPMSGRVPQSDLVFTEDEYHRLLASTLHWATVRIAELLSTHTALFIGLSMSDTNLRRLLDATRRPSTGPVHYAIRKNYGMDEEEARFALEEIRRRSGKKPRALGTAKRVRKAEAVALSSALYDLIRYDSLLFEDMNIAPMWIGRFEQISKILHDIPPPS